MCLSSAVRVIRLGGGASVPPITSPVTIATGRAIIRASLLIASLLVAASSTHPVGRVGTSCSTTTTTVCVCVCVGGSMDHNKPYGTHYTHEGVDLIIRGLITCLHTAKLPLLLFA